MATDNGATLATTASSAAEGKTADRVAFIPTNKIRENEVALRPVDKENEDYIGLADSVRKRGIITPITVRQLEKDGETYYAVIDGLQRWNAALDAGLKEIPAKITDKTQDEIEELQIIANAKRVETKAVQFAKQIERLLHRNPTMTVPQLAGTLSVTPGWVYKIMGMAKKLKDTLHEAVDNQQIKLSNALELAKLPQAEQEDWKERAMQMDVGEFADTIAQRVKDIRDARRQGKAEAPAGFAPVPTQRKWNEIKEEYTTHALRDTLIKKNNVTTAADGFDLAIAWTSNMDPDSQVEQKARYDAREKASKEAAERKALERTQKQEQEAKTKREELQKKLAEREAASAPATT